MNERLPDWFLTWLAECPMPTVERSIGIVSLMYQNRPLPVQFKRLTGDQRQELIKHGTDYIDYLIEIDRKKALRNEKH